MIVDLWLMGQSGMGGTALLPFAGGLADQPAALMLAFATVANAWHALDPNPPAKG